MKRTVFCLVVVLMAFAASSFALEDEEEDPSRPGQDLDDDVLTNGPLSNRRHRHEKSRKFGGKKQKVSYLFCENVTCCLRLTVQFRLNITLFSVGSTTSQMKINDLASF